jgi:hypothetical protein
LWIQKLTLGTASCRPQAPSVLHWHCVSVWQRDRFWKLGKSVWNLFLVALESDIRHGQLASCRPRCGEGARFGSLGSKFGASFLWIQKATLGTASCRPQAPSVLHWHGASAKESVLEAWESFWSWLLVIQKATLGTASCRQQAPFVLHWRCASVWRRDPFWKPR